MPRLAERFVGIEVCAKYLRVSRRWIERYMERRLARPIPFYRLPGGQIRFDLAEINDWVKTYPKEKRKRRNKPLPSFLAKEGPQDGRGSDPQQCKVGRV